MSRAKLVFWCFAAIAAFLLAFEHRVHLPQALPYLLLLACPLMHLFMHHGHGAHEHDAVPDEARRSEGNESTQR